LPAQAVGAAEEREVFAHREVAVQRELLRDVADALAGLRARMPQVDAGHAQLAAAGGQQAAEHAEGGGLARAVGAEQAEDLAAPHREAGAGHGGEIAEAAHEVFHFDDDFAGCACRWWRCGRWRP
jgi:hypothetical protein